MAELLIPFLGIAGLCYVSSSSSSSSSAARSRGLLSESFDPMEKGVPNEITSSGSGSGSGSGNDENVDDAFANVESSLTEDLSHNSRYHGTAYTDKYFNQSQAAAAAAAASQDNETRFMSLTGETVGTEYFRHNNMQPFFGSHVRSSISSNTAGDAHEAVLDAYTGQGSQSVEKRALAPLFRVEQLGMPYGAPTNNDFYQSRVQASTRMAGVRPFEPIQVGPGLGYGGEDAQGRQGHDGFNSGMLQRELWQDPSVDDLRYASKPKVSGTWMLDHEVPNSSVKKMGYIGQVQKNRVDPSFEMGQDRLFTTTGMEKGQTMHAMPVDRYVSRPETSASYVGGASVTRSSNEAMPGEYFPSKRQSLGPLPVGIVSAANKGGAGEGDFERLSMRAYPNNRTLTTAFTKEDYFGILGGAGTGIGAVVAPLLDALRPSRKENIMVENNLRPYLVTQQPFAKQPTVFNRNEPLPVTIRETTEKTPEGHFNIQANTYGVGAYMTRGVEVGANQRDTTSLEYIGVASAGEGARQPRVRESTYHQSDIKSSTLHEHMVPGNMGLFYKEGGGQAANGVRGRERANDRDTLLSSTSRNGGMSMPFIGTMGAVAATSMREEEAAAAAGGSVEENAENLLAQLKANPYTLDIRNAF